MVEPKVQSNPRDDFGDFFDLQDLEFPGSVWELVNKTSFNKLQNNNQVFTTQRAPQHQWNQSRVTFWCSTLKTNCNTYCLFPQPVGRPNHVGRLIHTWAQTYNLEKFERPHPGPV